MRFLIFALLTLSLPVVAGGYAAGTVAQPLPEKPAQDALHITGSRPGVLLPETFSARYSANYNGLPIKTERTLLQENGNYLLSIVASNVLGKISEREVLSIDSQGQITPKQYRYERKIFGKTRSETIDFDTSRKQVTTDYKGKSTVISYEGALFGPLSHQLQIRRDLLAGKTEFEYPLVFRGKLKTYRYAVVSEASLETPLGMLKTLQIKRLRDDEKRQTFLWLAKELDYLPVKLVQNEDGETHEMLISTYTSTAN